VQSKEEGEKGERRGKEKQREEIQRKERKGSLPPTAGRKTRWVVGAVCL
jgi:hypothetical protein